MVWFDKRRRRAERPQAGNPSGRAKRQWARKGPFSFGMYGDSNLRLRMGREAYLAQAGVMLFEGQSIVDLPMHERARCGITLAWQEPAWFEGLTVEDYLALGSGG